jgi:hypothetical protein
MSDKRCLQLMRWYGKLAHKLGGTLPSSTIDTVLRLLVWRSSWKQERFDALSKTGGCMELFGVREIVAIRSWRSETVIEKITSFSFQFLVVGWDWVHLARRPLIGLLYQPRMIDDECGAVGEMKIGRGNWSSRSKPAPVALSTTNPIWSDLDPIPGRRRGKPELWHGLKLKVSLVLWWYLKAKYAVCLISSLNKLNVVC